MKGKIEPEDENKKAETGDDDVKVEGEKVYMGRHMGLIQACGIIISQVIGTGIFLTPRGVTANIGSVGATLIIWAFCGVTNIMGSLMYAEMGAALPKAGGEYAFVKESFGPGAAFSVIWAMAFVVRPCSFVIMGRTAGDYFLQLFFPNCRIPTFIVTIFCLWLICKYQTNLLYIYSI